MQELEYAKLPPQALDLEEAVLGAMLLEKEAVNDAIDILHPEVFYKDAHCRIFEAIKKIFERSEPIDILTVTNELRSLGQLEFVGGAYFISQLTNRVASGANVEYHARIIVQKYLQRQLIRISSQIVKEAYEDTTDVFDLLDKAESDLFQVAEGNIRKNFDQVGDLVTDVVKGIEEAKDQEGGVNGIESGFRQLDRITSGWQPSDLIIMAARPGMGKTAFVLSMARNTAVRFQRGVGVFSLEMSSDQLVQRLIASETELSAESLRKGDLREDEWTQLNNKVDTLMDAPIYIDDTPALSVFELRAKCRRLVAQHEVELIIVDYLQLMTAGGDQGNREQEISTISRSLKSIAKELSVPIIALSQLNRTPETRGGDKRPQLSDLRESGAIEQDADIVSFIYRPEYYGLEVWEDQTPTQGMAELIVAKHRNGALDNVRLRFISRLAKFEDLEETEKGGNPAALSANTGFDEEAPAHTITRSSKMNDDDEPLPGQDNGPEDDGPSPF
ncbi:MAG: replicative DNA helicase [Flavobacteriales bacterium]